MAAGPNRDAWLEELERQSPDLLVTATGFADFEPSLWRLGRRLGIRSVAAIESWTNLRRRFPEDGGDLNQPDVLCVVDEWMRDRLLEEEWCRARLHVIGQPHLEALVGRLAKRRVKRVSGDIPMLVFFSETLRQDFPGDGPGYDQYSVGEKLVAALAGLGPLSLIIQPHPREDREVWKGWLAERDIPPGISVRIGGDSTESLLVACDGAIGMTTMVLVEAALLGVPVLSLQPGRKKIVNPVLDDLEGVRVVADGAVTISAVADFVGALGRQNATGGRLSPVLKGAGNRFLAALESEL